MVWSIYFDIARSRSEGRKIPKRMAVASPSLKEIVEAASRLNLSPQPKYEARYPRCWWKEAGYVVMDKINSKGETLKLLAKELSKLRGGEQSKG
ncbi:signal recognition particle subunit SRP19/SEC65 family protein [Candidatus Hecatella orcuttiae]|uniref:signal recognition particle subunit SRP19/SEC65 family protein n=1 Tax=Candidatus Hecatella orcuttiae TaxID=1935119 RepID=UPI0028683939|nr:signal recognition particle subunit SRP19/SEC65 family protein [Candidatus Hecatella orcuttiae]